MINNSEKNQGSFLQDINSRIAAYRYISMISLVELFLIKQLTLVKSSCWDDPYENYFAKCETYYKNGRLDVLNFRNQIFAQCWTLRPESDALWRIYSTDKKSIRIKSTIGKLSKFLRESQPSYIVKVCYLKRDEMKSHFRSIKKGDAILQTLTLIENFAIKQSEFSHEEEIRLVKIIPSDSINEDKMIENISVDPFELIEEITFDPRIEKSNETSFENLIRKIGFQGEVNKSKLYTLEPVVISMY